MGAFGGYWTFLDREHEMEMFIEWNGRVDYSVWDY